MRHQAVDRTGQMEIFARVVETGGFSAAAHQLKIAPSTVSKLIGRLESRLRTRLFQRSTRGLHLTDEGKAFYRRCTTILNDIAAAEEEAAAGDVPTGRLRVSVNVPVGHAFLLPAIPAFAARYPQVCLDLVLTDGIDDLVTGGADIAIRTGPLPASSLIARKLGDSRLCVVGSPVYFERSGTPNRPADLEAHSCLDFTFPREETGWPFRIDGGRRMVRPKGKLRGADGETVRRLALSGAGIARLAEFQVAQDIASGDLVEVLREFDSGDRLDVHAVYAGSARQLPARARVFIDFLVQSVRIS
jgi:DNA-binding transcriptional LysR family regulator